MRLESRDKKLLPQVTRAIVARLLVRALMNAAALIDGARALFDRGHYGMSRSLAISAREEVGKACMAASYLAGQISVEEFVFNLRKHRYKQAEGLILPTLAHALRNLPHLVRLLLPSTDALVPEALAETLRKMQLNSETLFSELSPTFDPLRARREMATEGLDEDSRQAGLYVTLSAGDGAPDFEYPQQVGASEAEVELARFEMLFSQFAGADKKLSSDLWTDDQSAERWAGVIEMVLQPGMFGATPDVAE